MNTDFSKIRLSHKATPRLLQSGVFFKPDGSRRVLKDRDGNLQPLRTYIAQLAAASKKLIQSEGHEPGSKEFFDAYKNAFGWQGEVLSEYWLRRFGHLYGLENIRDTSHNDYNRGFDLAADVIGYPDLVGQIQVKMFADSKAQLTEQKLFTFVDQMNQDDVLPLYGILMVPTADVPKRAEVLHYENGFQGKGSKRFRIVTMEVMEEYIREHCIESGHEEFLNGLMDAVEAYKA